MPPEAKNVSQTIIRTRDEMRWHGTPFQRQNRLRAFAIQGAPAATLVLSCEGVFDLIPHDPMLPLQLIIEFRKAVSDDRSFICPLDLIRSSPQKIAHSGCEHICGRLDSLQLTDEKGSHINHAHY